MFRTANLSALVKFNSAASSKFITMYEGFVQDKIRNEKSGPSSPTFAPSSFRCERKNWFRLRGVEVDPIDNPDVSLDFKARMGTACHQIIQTNLKEALGEDWIDVESYLKSNPIPYEYELSVGELETRVSIEDPPVRFACDGIIRWEGKLYLLEIKTADYSSFSDLTDPKEVHMDQIKCYATLLGISDVLVLYQDRQHGDLKCYEISISLSDKQKVLDKMRYIQHMAECNLAPDRLDRSDYMCSNCEYLSKCKEWG